MAETSDNIGDNLGGDRGADRGADRVTDAPRPSQTGSVPVLGFDDPSLRPLPPDRLDYHVPHPDAHPERHEHSDVPIRPLAISLAAIAITLTLMFVFLHLLFVRYKGAQEALELKRTNVPDAKPPVPGPRLQGVPGFSDKHPKVELKDLREQFDRELNGYGKTREDGFAQVPIDRAMDLAVERGLFKTAHQPGGGGAGASSSGAGAAAPTSQPRNPQRQGGTR
jgi:hypothetical protein